MGRQHPVSGFEPNWTSQTANWDEMNLPDTLLRGIFAYGFKVPSEIQQLAVAPILAGRHMIAQAQSGTGKTGAFVIGLLGSIDVARHETQGLIIAPTHELADQIYTFLCQICRYMNISANLFIGGHPFPDDRRNAQARPLVAVGTPGRLRALVEEGFLRVDNLKLLCLDEADELFRTEFSESIRRIIEYCPQETQPLFFSATIRLETFTLMLRAVRDPVKILVPEEKLTLEGISQFFVNVVSEDNKPECLVDLYGRLPIQKCIIFVNERAATSLLARALESRRFPVAAIHADLSQAEREAVMRRFRTGELRVLIGTDLIARGIDVQQVTLVINMQLPREREKYIHRVGRSGRYGRKGVAINIVSEEEVRQLDEYRRFYHTIIEELNESFARLVAEANESI